MAHPSAQRGPPHTHRQAHCYILSLTELQIRRLQPNRAPAPTAVVAEAAVGAAFFGEGSGAGTKQLRVERWSSPKIHARGGARAP
ncbi:Os03g0411200 [Oryza sativa Japonica Group]|uniref:Os03g0411200 protein n=1 Tax=Oryza sativa subsp. japonica TaxID=39947 RepID=A0A0P0VYM7_ORYSJ|nr:Os03g0411200 [Oryza sativa Japonica Group]